MKKRIVIIIFVVLIVLGIGGFFLYNKLLANNNSVDFLPSLSNKKVKDIKNGIYVYSRSLNKQINIYRGCMVSSYDDYIVVLGNKYRRYIGNCMLMKDMGEKTNDLDFQKENDGKYYINFDGNKYIKNDNITSIPIGNGVIRSMTTLPYNNIDFVVKNTEKKGEYYNFTTTLTGFKNSKTFSFSKAVIGDGYTVKVGDFSSNYDKIEDFPKILSYSGNLLVIDSKNSDSQISSNIFIYNNSGLTYVFSRSLPLKVNGEIIDSKWSSIFRYDNATKKFFVVFSKNKAFCVDDDSSISYYEFSLDYDYRNEGFRMPEFVKKGIGSKSCDYVKKYYFEG